MIIRKIENVINQNRTLITNFSYLAILRVFVLLIPLISYPYLIRVLGANLYGTVIFAQSVIAYFSIVINFGFNISATKEVSNARADNDKLGEIVSSVLVLKFLLWLVSLFILLLLIYFLNGASSNKLLFFFAFGICFNELLFPVWFFQGIEKMKYITYLNLCSRLLALLLIFIVIKDKSDYLFVPLLNGIGAFVGGIGSLYVIIYKEKVKFIVPSVNSLKYYLLDSLPLFGTRVASQIYVNTSAVVIGMFLGKTEVAYFDLANKICSVVKMPISILSQAIFPKVSKEKNINFVLKVLKLTSFGMVIFVILVGVFAKYPILFIGSKEMMPAINIVRILLLSIIPIVFSTFLGTQILVSFGYSKYLVKSMVSASIFYLILLSTYYYLEMITISSIAILAVLVELFLAIYQFKVCKKFRLI